MKSMLNSRQYADRPQENILTRDSYWEQYERRDPDDEWDEEEEFNDDEIDEF